jgi:hypothetical protein
LGLSNGFAARGVPGVHDVAQQANAALAGALTQQAYVSAFDDASLVLAVAAIIMLALIPLFQVSRTK